MACLDGCAPHTESPSYSDFKALLPKEKLEALRRSGQGEHGFVTVRVDDPTLIPELEAAKARFPGQVENVWLSTLLSWILPAVIFFALWGASFSRSSLASVSSWTRRARSVSVTRPCASANSLPISSSIV